MMKKNATTTTNDGSGWTCIPRERSRGGRSRILRVRDVATKGMPTYVIEVAHTATVADAVVAFLATHASRYPFRYITGILADNRLLSSATELGMRVETLSRGVIDVVPFVPEVEAILRRWSDNARNEVRGQGGTPRHPPRA